MISHLASVSNGLFQILNRDQSIPKLESTMSESQSELQKLAGLLTSQIQLEQSAYQNHTKAGKVPARCCEPPLVF